jgi:hypothetical protein
MKPSAELRTAADTLRNARFAGAMTATPAVAALIRAREPLARWLDSWAVIDLREHAAMQEDARHALTIARAINSGEQQ